MNTLKNIALAISLSTVAVTANAADSMIDAELAAHQSIQASIATHNQSIKENIAQQLIVESKMAFSSAVSGMSDLDITVANTDVEVSESIASVNYDINVSLSNDIQASAATDLAETYYRTTSLFNEPAVSFAINTIAE